MSPFRIALLRGAKKRRGLALAAAALVLIVACMFVSLQAATKGELSGNRIIHSEILGYKLQYRVYRPSGVPDDAKLPALYVTDGQWYIRQGGLPGLMDRLIGAGRIQPLMAIFVDNRDPDNLHVNRRNQQFFCNQKYADFYRLELIPEIERQYATQPKREARVVLGLSFGGLAAACFGLQAHDSFGGIAMQSPATHPVPELHNEYRSRDQLPLRIFLSSGDHDDNEAATRRFRQILQDKGHEMHYVEVPFGHNWGNWKPLLDDVLTFFFAPPDPD